MMSRPRMIFVIFFITSILLVTVYLRTSSSRIFFGYRLEVVRQGRLRQQLWQKQLELESLVTPAAVSERLESSELQ